MCFWKLQKYTVYITLSKLEYGKPSGLYSFLHSHQQISYNWIRYILRHLLGIDTLGVVILITVDHA